MMKTQIRILHLEDNPRDAGLVRDLLESAGVDCEIVQVADRRNYETLLDQDRFDIIFTDNNLPDYDGVSALKTARARQPSTPVVVISGTLGEYEAVKCLQFGATDYLLKDRLERLVPAFQRALTEAQDRQAKEAAETELRANEERMRLALTATNDAIWDWDVKAGRLIGNATFERFFGVVEPGCDPRDWWYAHTHPDDRDAVRAGLFAAIDAGEEFWAASFKMRRADGQWAHVQNRACLARDDDGAVTRLIGAAQDITVHVRGEDERRTLEAQLRQAQKMEAIGTLAGGIAHDFNNILGVILTNAELAKLSLPGGLPDAEGIAESLQEIYVAGNRARDLVGQILTFSRRAVGERRLINPHSVVQECLRLLRTTIPRTITLEERIEPARPCVMADSTQLHQIVMNICTNAWHALPGEKGRIEVSVETCDPSDAVLRDNPDLEHGEYVRISIADDGQGMDEATRARIFEPFFTTKASGKGTGLGLSVVHGIVKAHGGSICVASEPGKGTRFDVYLPVQEGTAEVSNDAVAVPRVGDGQRILIVDGETAMGRAMQRYLKRLGYVTQVFHSPDVALDVLREAPHHFDAVITEFALPSMNGVEFGGRVLHMRPDMPMIITTGALDIEEEKLARLTAFKSVLKKPISPGVLADAIARALADTRPEQR